MGGKQELEVKSERVWLLRPKREFWWDMEGFDGMGDPRRLSSNERVLVRRP